MSASASRDRRWYVDPPSASSSSRQNPETRRQNSRTGSKSGDKEEVATVFVRVRGGLNENSLRDDDIKEEGCLEVLDERTIRCVTAHAGVAASMGGGNGAQYRVDRVIAPSKSTADFSKEQGNVYENMARRAVTSFLSGSSSMVLAYGQTGSGKTFTMTGPPGQCAQHPGVIPRALEEVFSTADSALAEGRVRFLCAYIEVYNDKIYDLLRPEKTPPNGFDIRDDPSYGVVIPG